MADPDRVLAMFVGVLVLYVGALGMYLASDLRVRWFFRANRKQIADAFQVAIGLIMLGVMR